jgi:hypothetical protein
MRGVFLSAVLIIRGRFPVVACMQSKEAVSSVIKFAVFANFVVFAVWRVATWFTIKGKSYV